MGQLPIYTLDCIAVFAMLAISTVLKEASMAKSVVAKLKTLVATAPTRLQRLQKEQELRQKALFTRAVRTGVGKLHAHAESKASGGEKSFACYLSIEDICPSELSRSKHDDVAIHIANHLKKEGFAQVVHSTSHASDGHNGPRQLMGYYNFSLPD